MHGNNKPAYTQNRELSWLKFNERVLEEAQDSDVPVMERLKYVSIFTNNLDEFFMVRVGSLFNLSIDDDSVIDNKSGMTPSEQLKEIYKAVRPLYQKRDAVFSEIEEELRAYGVCSLKFNELDDDEQRYIKTYFAQQILPILSPQIVDVHHPFPHLNNKSVHIAVSLRHKRGVLLGLIPLPDTLPAVLKLPGSAVRYILTQNIIMEYGDTVFGMYDAEYKNILCVTRNADINYGEESYDMDDDYRYRVKRLLGRRRRMSVVRLEFARAPSEYFENYFCEKMNIERDQIFITNAPMKVDYTSLLFSELPKPITRSLTYSVFVPQPSADINENDGIMRQVRNKDVFLSYPFDRMEPFLRMVKEAANDPSVISIKISIYRVAQKARLIEYLCAAAENGKDVTALIELRARFDEQNNINWSERLEESGCNVIYGFDEYKIHAKVCLITKKEKNEIQYITQVGTGNYNEVTAELYTDLSLITADKRIGQDAANFFKDMAIANLNGVYAHLLVAPNSFKNNVLQLIDEQIGLKQDGMITFKINSLTDIDVIKKLAEASGAGVPITLIVRGICCLLPGVAGHTENIRVISIVGRFLEHSRIYAFGTGSAQKIYISSGDMMTRNTNRRVEISCPILDDGIKRRINDMLDIMLSDNIKARLLRSDGFYEKIGTDMPPVNSQEVFMQEALKTAAALDQGSVKKPGPIRNAVKRWLEGVVKKL